jgi:hypothetical protein
MANHFEQFSSRDNTMPPETEKLESEVDKDSKKWEKKERFNVPNPKNAGENDLKELEKFVGKTQSEILFNILESGNGRLGVDDIRLHDEKFAPQKIAAIERDSQKWVDNMPANLDRMIEDPNNYKSYVEFLQANGRGNEIMDEKDYSALMEKLRTALAEKNPEVERMLRERYESDRLKSMIGAKTEAEKKEPVDNPYREIEKRLLSAGEQLKKEGLNEDAENLTKTIKRIQKDIEEGKQPSEMLLWDIEVDEKPREEPKGIDKWLKKIDNAMLKTPLLGRYMSRDYRESVRKSGGTIIRANGSYEKFYTFTRFKKPEEKTRTNDLAGNDYDYLIEPQTGDEVVSWEPSKRGEEIIMKALAGAKKPESTTGFGSSIGESGIEYWTSEYHTGNVEFRNRKNRDPETRQIYSYAKLGIFPPPNKG